MNEEYNKVDTLASRQYEKEFQAKVISVLISDRAFLERIYDILTPDFFDTDQQKWIVSKIIDHWKQYKDTPTMMILGQECNLISDSTLQMAVKSQLLSAFKNASATDLTYVKDKFLEFCKHQKLKSAIADSLELLKNQKFDTIKLKLDEALKAGMDRDIGENYFESFETRSSKDTRYTIKTNQPILDKLMDGGLGKGELGIICGNPGGCKSWTLVNFGAEALKQGKNVLHFTMELSADYTGHRYDSYLSGIPFQERQANKAKIKVALDATKANGAGTLYIKYFPLKTATADTLKAFTEHLQIVTGIHIDMWVVDYVDLLLSSTAPKGSKSYEDAGAKSEEVRSVLGSLQIAGWSVSQANRCLSLQTIVNEELKGNIKIKNIIVGDKILTHNGYRKVSYIYPVKKQPVYRITLKSGKIIECSENHRFPTQYEKLKSIISGLSIGDKLFTKK